MNLSKLFIFALFSIVSAIVFIGCTTNQLDGVVTEVKEVPVVVTKLVEVVVTREVIVEVATREVLIDSEGEAVATVVVTATPIPTLTPTPRSPEDIGEPGEFTPGDLDKLFEIWDDVEEDFYGELPSDDILTDAIIEAALEQLGDRYTTYFPPALAQQIQDGFRGDFEGIGAYVDTNEEGVFFIVRPIPNTPAFRAGLKPRDLVLAVDGQSVVGWETDAVVAIVRGPKGEPVTLTIQREGEPDPFDIAIIRDQIIVPVVETQLLADDKIGYVRLISFNQVATQQLEPAVQAHLDAGAEAIIFDVRDNGGGLLTEAITVGDLFLDDGKFVIIREGENEMRDYETDSGDIGEEVQLVVLINEFSASASELVSGALKDRGRATLIGTNTFGKGSVQSVFYTDDGSEYRITSANFYSPNDNIINGIGIAPDIISDFRPEILGDENDETLQRAIDFILTGE